jgi:glycosyltransferase involved in cell wall biosynthesis
MSQGPQNILIISSDWRDIFRSDFDELKKKLDRDQLCPDSNRFFFFSWALTSYTDVRNERFSTVHVKTRWRFFRPWTDMLSLFLVPRALKQHNFTPDIILVYDFGLLPAARRVKRMYGGTPRIVLCLTNMPELYSRVRRWGSIKLLYSRFIERAFRTFIDVAYTINAPMKHYLMHIGIDEKKIVIFVSNTIVRDRVHIEAAKKGIVRSRYDIGAGTKVILSIGRLEAEKGFEELFKLFAALPSSYVLMVLGRGSLEGALKTLAVSLGIQERVIFVGWVGRDAIWNYYLDANAFVLLSKAEALGLVFWEAMYMGVPVIGSTAEGIVESIGSDGDRGFIYDNEGASVFCQKVEKAVTVSRERDLMITRAKQYVQAQIEKSVTINDL